MKLLGFFLTSFYFKSVILLLKTLKIWSFKLPSNIKILGFFFFLFVLPFMMCFSLLSPGGLVMWPVLIFYLKQDNISLCCVCVCVCLSYSHNTMVWDLPWELPAVNAGIRARVSQPLPGLYPLKHMKTSFFAHLLITRSCLSFFILLFLLFVYHKGHNEILTI